MRRQDGSVTTELVLITPVLLVLLGFVVMTGRIGEIDGAVTHAAHQAARAASLTGNAASATTAARTIATSNLASIGVNCSNVSVQVDTSRFEPGGDVGVGVTCTVDLSDIAFAGLPGTRTLDARAVEVIDRHRGVGP
jgi:Flp pilus assembly protein TadG